MSIERKRSSLRTGYLRSERQVVPACAEGRGGEVAESAGRHEPRRYLGDIRNIADTQMLVPIKKIEK